MNTRFKVFASYIILQYLCDFIHVFIFVTISKCRKSPKLTNIMIKGISTIHVRLFYVSTKKAMPHVMVTVFFIFFN